MKKIFLLFVLLLFIIIAVFAWLIAGSGTNFQQKSRYLYIGTNKANPEAILDSINKNDLLSNPGIFNWLATRLNVWDKVKPGRFEIRKGQSILSVARMLRNNQQSAVNFTILKLRTKEDLAKQLDKYFETDYESALSYLTNADSIGSFNVDTNTLMTLVIPNTYTMFWTTPVNKILSRLKTEQQNFWSKNNRLHKADAMGFSPAEIYTIASIVEEETNANDEKGDVASVYINRYHKGMALGADPTVKFALKDFGLKRIMNKHTEVASPYNTYRNRGLPPGPICTPSPKTIDAVLNAPQTDYIFFVAKPGLDGHHTFTTNYAEHLKYAHEYQQWLDDFLARKQNK